MNLIKITPDKERVRSILKMISLIEERIKLQNKPKMAALVLADYYEVIKELLTALLLIDGYKTLSHKDLIDYLEEYYNNFNKHEIVFMHDLRAMRNRIIYEGLFVDLSYLERNKTSIKKIIEKLKNLIKNKL